MLGKFDAGKTWQELLSSKEMRPNVLMAVPTVYVKLIEEYEKTFAKSETQISFVKETCKQNMRVFISGSAALPVPVIEKFERISGHRALERYGMTGGQLIGFKKNFLNQNMNSLRLNIFLEFYL